MPSGKRRSGDAMTRKLLALTVLVATLTAGAGAAGAAPSPMGSSRRMEAPAGDPASVTAFVGQIRADAERAQSRPRSLQEAVAHLVSDLPQAPRCLTPVLGEVSRQGALSSALTRFVQPVFTRPALPHEMLFTTTDGLFTVHYTVDRANGDGVLAVDKDASGIPDYVDQVAASLSLSRRKIVGRLGYRDLDGDAPVDVFLANLGGRVDGYFVRAASGQSTYLVIDSRLLGNDALLRA